MLALSRSNDDLALPLSQITISRTPKDQFSDKVG